LNLFAAFISFLSFFSFASDRFRAELFKHAAILIHRDVSSGGQATHYTMQFIVWGHTIN